LATRAESTASETTLAGPQAAAVTPPQAAGRRGLVTLVLPAKNEEAGIGATLRSLPLATLEAQGFGHEVLVLDGASRDRTRDIARAWGAAVVEQDQPGKGSAVRLARERMRGDYVVMLDADATYPSDAIPRIVDTLARGEADVVMGSRRRGWVAPGAMGPLNRVGNAALSAMASVLYLRRCSDVCTGLWGFRGPVLRALPLESRGFELEVELFGRSARAGARVREVPVDYLPRRGGTKLSRARDGLRIGWWLLRTRLVRARPAAQARARPAAPEEPALPEPRAEEVRR
jgi:dolichol-phosphate mannosyltransferase